MLFRSVPITAEGILSDTDIAKDLLAQADRMKREAESLLSEVQRLTEQAAKLSPAVKVKKVNAPKAKVKAH